jgi:hypothetical protein
MVASARPSPRHSTGRENKRAELPLSIQRLAYNGQVERSLPKGTLRFFSIFRMMHSSQAFQTVRFNVAITAHDRASLVCLYSFTPLWTARSVRLTAASHIRVSQ